MLHSIFATEISMSEWHIHFREVSVIRQSLFWLVGAINRDFYCNFFKKNVFITVGIFIVLSVNVCV